MASGFEIKIEGIEELQSLLKALPETVKKQVDGVIENAAKKFVRAAQRDAPKDTGFLTGQISYYKVEGGWEIVSGSNQAGYLEFGTKRNYRAIPGFEAEAASIRGKGNGTYEEGLDNITQWVKRKGIRIQSAATFKKGKKAGQNKQLTLEQTAWLIFHFILLNGIKAQPYFFKQVPNAIEDINRGLQALKIDE